MRAVDSFPISPEIQGNAATGHQQPSSMHNTSRMKGSYRKMLWFKQPFPDNYTDEETFLDHLQRNPKLRPYQFWSLVAEGTVIVQHLASVAIFCCSFIAIFNDRVSPLSVVGWATFFTILGWLLWDHWLADVAQLDGPFKPMVISQSTTKDISAMTVPRLSRSKQRLSTAKSAGLIYAALLGLSPILKSLTLSTTSDSIWALSTWLLIINVAFFDYAANPSTQLSASISTNSAMMASAVLASRLASTTHVFCLTLFSIEMFGLFPIFRRQLRLRSSLGHFCLAGVLIATAWGAVFVTLTGQGRGAFMAGVLLGGIMTFLFMGLCSWWLIGLQKYKNEIHGPWDPAKPLIRQIVGSVAYSPED